MDNYARDVRRFAEWAAARGRPGPDGVTASEVREFVYALKDLGLSTATIRRQISALRSYYRFLVSEGHAVRDPTELLETPKGWRTLPTVLRVEEVERLVAAPRGEGPLPLRDRALLELGYATGARVSELVSLSLQDLLYEEGLVRVLGKGSKQRLEPLGRRALGQVALYVRESQHCLDRGKGRGRLFLNARGTPLSRVGDASMGAVAVCLANIGPGLGSTGPMTNYSEVPVLGKWILSIVMLLGRLELFTILVLFSPTFWKK